MMPDTPSASGPSGLIDEKAIRRFEAAWRSGQVEPIEALLPPPDDPSYLPTLRELVLVELELLWRAHAGPGTDTDPTPPRPPVVEDYLERFPCLDRPDLLGSLLEQENEVRQRWGDQPSVEEYRARFPTLSLTLSSSPQLLAAVLPRTIAGYEILGVIGRGGMGVVYRARQLSLKRTVAIKLIRAAAHAGSEEVARFRAEAETLARLQHPNVVQIHEVGEHDGCPYLVLEHVEGGSLAQQLKGTPQPPREAAVLIETLARAVHAVHGRSIIHRDLKPANILLHRKSEEPNPKSEAAVSDFGFRISDFEPKVSDFGLAKRLDADAAQTGTGQVLGTPSYMAPEQASGQARAVGPAADVYSLGAILYELLTGRPPFAGGTASETLHQVLSADPLAPRRLRPGVPRDLEIICLACLEKEPARRYGSAADLAEDLRRFLAGEPIRAQPASPWRRAVKWARRRPALAALLLVIMLAAAGLALGGLWHNAQLSAALTRTEEEREHARANYRVAREAVETMLTRVSQQRLAYLPQMEHARRDILKDALAFYLRFLDDNRGDPEARHDTALAYGRVGTINQLLDRHAEAEAAFRQALDLLGQLMVEFPAEPTYRYGQVVQHNDLGLLYRSTGRFAEAETILRAGLEVADRLASDFPEAPRHRRQRAYVRNNLGILLEAVGDFAGAEECYRQAVDEYAALHAAAPAEADYPRELALARNNLAVLLTTTGRLDEAARNSEAALALQQKLAGQSQELRYRWDLARGYLTRGNVLTATSRPGPGRQAMRQAERLCRSLVKDFPGVPAYRRDLLQCRINLGLALTEERDRGPAREALAEAVALGRQLRSDCPDVPEVARDLAGALVNWALLRRAEGHREDAEAAGKEARTLLESLTARYPAVPDYRHSLAVCLDQLARLDTDAGRISAAEKANQQALRLLDKLVADFPKVPGYRSQRATTVTSMGLLLWRGKRLPEAERALGTAVAQHEKLANDFPRRAAYRRDLARVHVHLSNLKQAQGDHKQAVREVQQAITLQEQVAKETPGDAQGRQELARYHFNLGMLLGQTVPLKEREAVYAHARKLQECLVAEAPKTAVFHWDLAATLNEIARLWLAAGRAPEALELVQRAMDEQQAGLRLDDSDPRQRWAVRVYQSSHVEALVHLGRHAEVEQAAAKLWQMFPERPEGYLSAAWFLARCVPLAERDQSLDVAQRRQTAGAYAKRAVALLRQAVAKGLRDARQLRANEAFGPLAGRADFQAVLRELEALQKKDKEGAR
jgi:serine/threonine-protein kinase